MKPVGRYTAERGLSVCREQIMLRGAGSKVEKLLEEIRRLEAEKAEREAALPVHSVRPHQIQAIEELEEEIDRKREELKKLDGDAAFEV